jgi:hypothetical protein
MILSNDLAQVTSEVANHLKDGDYRIAFRIAIEHASTTNGVDNALLSVIMTVATYRAGKS